MAATVDILHPKKPKKILIIAGNSSVSKATGWPIGFWWSELTHPYWEFVEHGYLVDIASPDGGDLQGDGYSDPEDPSEYSAHDLISLGFKKSEKHLKLLRKTKSIKQVKIKDYDAVLVVGGQSPMYTMINHKALHKFIADFYEAEKVVAVICHATCILQKVKLSNGKYLVDGKTWTGFANSEEAYADTFAGVKIQPFRIEDEAKKMKNTNFIVDSMFKSHAIRDGRLITGQQQYSGVAAATLIIEALGR